VKPQIPWEDLEIIVRADGLLEFDHADFPEPLFLRGVPPSTAEAFNASRNSQPSQSLRPEPATRKNCRVHSSQNFSSTTSTTSGWFVGWALAVFIGLILGLLQGGH
jgi:hypothetical protein